MSRHTRLLAALLLSTSAGAVCAGEIVVDKAEPENVKPGFSDRIRAGKLAPAFARRGQVVRVADGKYSITVPCEHSKVSDSNEVHVTVREGSLTRVRVLDCGVEVRVKTVFH